MSGVFVSFGRLHLLAGNLSHAALDDCAWQVPQSGLAVVAVFPVQSLTPPYAVVGETDWLIDVGGVAGTGDVIILVPFNATCSQYLDLPQTDTRYARCACVGAATSDQGGAIADGGITLSNGLAAVGSHVVCHAFSGRANLDEFFEPQREVTPARLEAAYY